MRSHRVLTCAALLLFLLEGKLAAVQVYWSNSQGMHRANQDGTNQELQLVDGAGEVRLDLDAGYMVWTSGSEALKRADLSGKNPMTLSPEPGVPGGLRFADSNATLYWSVPEGDLIKRANADGSNQQTWLAPIGDGYRPSGLAIDEPSGKLYWSEVQFGGEGRIRRANLDGSQPETLFVNGISTAWGEPSHLEIDPVDGWIYWTNRWNDAGQGASLWRMRLDGSDAHSLRDFSIQTGVSSDGLALDVFDRKLYWTQTLGNTEGAVWRSNLDGTDAELVFDAGAFAHGLALDLSIPGDANGDRTVDLSDFGILKANFGAGTRRSQGDLNADRQVDLTDFGILKSNFGTGVAAAVPEPAGCTLALLGMCISLLERTFGKRAPK